MLSKSTLACRKTKTLKIILLLLPFSVTVGNWEPGEVGQRTRSLTYASSFDDTDINVELSHAPAVNILSGKNLVELELVSVKTTDYLQSSLNKKT